MIKLPLIDRFNAITSIIFAVTLFALANILVKNISNIPTVQVVYFRSVFILLATHLLLRQEKIKIFKQPEQKKLWLRGLSGTLGLFLLFWTIQNLPLATAVTLHYLSPLFTIILAAIFLKEKVSPMQFLALTISIVGVGIIKKFDPNINSFELFVAILAALFAGIAYTTIRSLKGKAHPLLIVYYFPLVTIPLCTYHLIVYWQTPTLLELSQLCLIGILTFIAQLFLTQAYLKDRPSIVAPFNYLGIFYATIFGVLIFEEAINLKMVFGFILVILGVWWSNTISAKNSKNGEANKI